MKIVCVKCETEFVPDTNGAFLIEMFQKNKEIYKIWHGDIWKCPTCGAKVVAGLGQEPIMHHFQGDCWSMLKGLQDKKETIVFDKELM